MVWQTDVQHDRMRKEFQAASEYLMPATTKTNARLNFRLRTDHKQVIEAAASQLGQSVSDFAVTTLVRHAREVVREQAVTQLSNRDRNIFIAALDRADLKPNKKLLAAAGRYKRDRKSTRLNSSH